MARYAEVYLQDVVINQGRLFDLAAQNYPDCDTEEFIHAYMKSKTRQSIDQGQAYVLTMSARDLWDHFRQTENYSLKPGTAMGGFMPDWIGEFYAYYQWHYDIKSSLVVDLIPLDFLKKAYHGLHDLELDLAVQKVGRLC